MQRPLISHRWILAFGLALVVAVALPNILGGWYLDSDDWLIIRMGETVEKSPQIDQFTGFWTEEPTWRPLLTARTALEAALFGRAYRPRLLINLALHLVCALLLFWAARAWLGNPRAAAWTAVLYAAHPLHAEALAWFHSGFEGITATVPILLTLALYAAQKPRWLTLLAFQTALLTRENALAIPLLIAAAAATRAPAAARLRHAATQAAPFVALLALNAAARLFLVSVSGHRATVGSFHLVDHPLAALLTTALHPWLPIHPALPHRRLWWALFALVPVGLAITQRHMDRRELKTALVAYALLCLPFLPQFHDATRFLNAWPGGYEQRWYYFHLPLAALMIWPAYVLVQRDYRQTGWSTLALAALTGLFLLGQGLNARWWRDLGAIPRQTDTLIQNALAERPRALGIIVTDSSDAAELTQQVFLNLHVIHPETRARRLRVYAVRYEGSVIRRFKAATDPSGQPIWTDQPDLPSDIRWWRLDPQTHRLAPSAAPSATP